MTTVLRINNDHSLSLKGSIYKEWSSLNKNAEIDRDYQIDLSENISGEVDDLFLSVFNINTGEIGVDQMSLNRFGDLIVPEVITEINGFDESRQIDTESNIEEFQINDSDETDKFIMEMFNMNELFIEPREFSITPNLQILTTGIIEEQDL